MSEPQPAYKGRVKYNEKTARKYQVRKEGKHLAEMQMVEKAFAKIPKTHRVLDVPCGGGRVSVHLGKKGFQMSCADLSDAMIRIARETTDEAGLKCTVEKQDIEGLTYADKFFDTIVSFRLFHHFPDPEIRQRAVTELCRVARKYVALSYFSPLSVTSAKRKLRVALGGRKSDKHSTSLSEVKNYFAQAGFKLVKDVARTPLIHTMHLALFERIGETAP